LNGTANECTTDPDVPVTVIEYEPAIKLVPARVRVAVAGKELTMAGLRLQFAEPAVVLHASDTVPEKPSCPETEIDPEAPVLPAFTSGNGCGSLNTKSGFEVTTTVKDDVSADAPEVVA
jgi:hypothetical protein